MAAARRGGRRILVAWWIPATSPARIGHILLCHGNAGNIASRIGHAGLLAAAGFDVLLFDYRGYGLSEGRPTEAGTYLDARAALRALLARPGVSADRVFYLGESLGGAVAIELALHAPPRGLILLSTFSSLRDVAGLHYPILPRFVVPDAYPSLVRIAKLTVPLLILHGSADAIVPLGQGEALFRQAPEPKEMKVFDGAGHNDLVPRAGAAYAAAISDWARRLPPR